MQRYLKTSSIVLLLIGIILFAVGNLRWIFQLQMSRQKVVEGHKILINGANLFYIKVGSGEHVVLLIPGALGVVQNDYAYQLDKMDREKFTLVAWDPRGYGLSRPPDRDFVDDFLFQDANDAAALMMKLGFKTYSVVGWSDGANVAAILAAKFSDSIRKLVMVAGNSFVTPEEIAAFKKIRDMPLPKSYIYSEESYTKLWHGFIDYFVNKSKNGQNDIFTKELDKIKCETLIIHGDSDELVPNIHGKYFNNHIRGSRLMNWEGGSHDIPVKESQKFTNVVVEFLEQKEETDLHMNITS